MIKSLWKHIKIKLIVKWRILKIRIGWNYNIRFMEHLISNYHDHPINFVTISEAQATHLQQELLKDDLEIKCDLTKFGADLSDHRTIN